MWPFIAKKKIDVLKRPDRPKHRVLHSLYHGLVDAKANRITLDRNRFSFVGSTPFIRISRKSALASVSSGEVTIRRIPEGWEVAYTLRFTSRLIIVTLTALLSAGLIGFFGHSLLQGFFFAGVLWLFAVADTLSASKQFSILVRRLVEQGLQWEPRKRNV
jgi:hypothetical protein